uniref:Somatostatin 1, tandem duplicate 1 n=1 Tax=Sinocyclocheilus grahami TaxID=75366 RepID=A0A672LEB7_SINGR
MCYGLNISLHWIVWTLYSVTTPFLLECNELLCTFFLRVSTLSNAPSATSIYTLADLLSDLVQAENEALEPEDLSRAVEKDDVRLELERAAGPMLAPRERKAGCKNFFWKTFTSC